MLILGAKGHAKEILEVLHQNDQATDIVFYDDVSSDLPEKLYGQYGIIHSLADAMEYFIGAPEFIIGIGNPELRSSLTEKFIGIGGKLCSIISNHALIGHYHVTIGDGVNIMPGVIIYNDVEIGKGALINTRATIHHDSSVGNFSEISPGTHILGRAKIGSKCFIGAGATILSGVNICDNVVIGAGAVITKNIEEPGVWVGVPGRRVK